MHEFSMTSLLNMFAFSYQNFITECSKQTKKKRRTHQLDIELIVNSYKCLLVGLQIFISIILLNLYKSHFFFLYVLVHI